MKRKIIKNISFSLKKYQKKKFDSVSPLKLFPKHQHTNMKMWS